MECSLLIMHKDKKIKNKLQMEIKKNSERLCNSKASELNTSKFDVKIIEHGLCQRQTVDETRKLSLCL